ncbi:lytic murein transglycosylase [Sulfurimonas sp. HSL-3221]|uniref:lytic murein transglycosylase n=1 Tax=Sulfurimonadaceae TaxID=2771471 RepID=UPI001E35DA9A|nr:lytic murein transglycosylase [Sulfurimonas sp. HSL-3221]UFS61410.1 lytic murein transglycosylase [Sulfurimonas sp. HSL-3221]
MKVLTSKRAAALLLPLLGSTLFAYSDCAFRLDAYETICKKAVSKGVSIDYANRYLLDPQTALRDGKSLRLFSPKMITVHHANEKRANNALVTFVPTMVENLRQYRAVYDEAERRFHVNREVIAAILAKETRLGRFGSKHDAFTVFNTLVRELPANTPRNKGLLAMAERNIVSLMDFCYANGIAPAQCRFKSSYAGAVGIPQFMPQNFYLIERYGEGTGDLERMEDAILSTARFLNENAAFKALIDWKKFPEMPTVESAWYDYDFANDNASFAFDKGRNGHTYNCFACKKPELDDLAGYVKKIMRYNNSSNYAVGVLRLAYDAHLLLNK